eukprot:7194772-Alexandrium_andersonii.AAC.1
MKRASTLARMLTRSCMSRCCAHACLSARVRASSHENLLFPRATLFERARSERCTASSPLEEAA